MVRNLDGKIKIVPMVIAHNSTTDPVFGTSASNVSRAVEIPAFMEATFIFTHKENPSTTATSNFTCKLQECDTEGGTYTDITQDESTNAARFFESQATPGTLIVGTSAEKASYYGTILTNPRKRWVKAVPTNGVAALSYNIICVLSEPRFNDKAQTSDFRVVSNDNGVAV